MVLVLDGLSPSWTTRTRPYGILQSPALSVATPTKGGPSPPSVSMVASPLMATPPWPPASPRGMASPASPAQLLASPCARAVELPPTLPDAALDKLDAASRRVSPLRLRGTWGGAVPLPPAALSPHTLQAPPSPRAPAPLTAALLSPSAATSVLLQGTPQALLPPKAYAAPKYVVVLDLDETLVFARRGPVVPRPGCQSLMRLLKKHSASAETVVWTAGAAKYAHNAVAQIDAAGTVTHLVPRDPAWCTGPGAVKDLGRLGRDVDMCLLLENSADCVRANPDCALLVPDFDSTTLESGELMAAVESVIAGLLVSGQTVSAYLAGCPLLHRAIVPCQSGGTVSTYVLTGLEPQHGPQPPAMPAPHTAAAVGAVTREALLGCASPTQAVAVPPSVVKPGAVTPLFSALALHRACGVQRMLTPRATAAMPYALASPRHSSVLALP